MPNDALKEIQDNLDDIKSILLLVNQSRLEEAKKELLKEGSEEEKIYQLCDSKTTQEIAAVVQKSDKYETAVISTLRRKGLIKTLEKEGKKVHKQRF
jgi:uncharacterized membrane protein YgaE (UPF0421/DUF939 family)